MKDDKWFMQDSNQTFESNFSKLCLFVLTYFKNPSIIFLWWQHNLLQDLCSLESIKMRKSKAILFVLLVGFLFVVLVFFFVEIGIENFKFGVFFSERTERSEVRVSGTWSYYKKGRFQEEFHLPDNQLNYLWLLICTSKYTKLKYILFLNRKWFQLKCLVCKRDLLMIVHRRGGLMRETSDGVILTCSKQ